MADQFSTIGIEGIYIRETVADEEDPVLLPTIQVDESTLSMIFHLFSPLKNRQPPTNI
jgi:predicted membrane GTPase involved in stress response